MPIDTKTPGSEGWWLQRLAKALEQRQPRLEKLKAYFEGNPPLPTGAENAKKAYQAFQRKARTNFAELIVAAVLERMNPRAVVTAAENDADGDAAASTIARRNGLKVAIADVLESMLSVGDGYVIVGIDDDDEPLITCEDPRQVITEQDPARPRRTVAALKLFHDPIAQRDFAYLYLPGRLKVAYREVRRGTSNPKVQFSASSWEWDDERSGDLPDGLDDVVPVIRFQNKGGVGEFERHLDLLDRINHMILQRMVIATMQAFRQRAIKGDLPEHDENGKEIDYDEVLSADPGALWQLPAAVELWESGQADLSPILSSVKDDALHLSAVTRTPLFYLTPDAANGSAEGASLMREGLVFKTQDRIDRADGPLVDVWHLAFRMKGDADRADRDQIKVLWASPERRSLAERADAASKATGLPFRTTLEEIWQFTPDVIAAAEKQRNVDGETDPIVRAARSLTGDVGAA